VWGADNGAALGTVLEAGMTSGGALARDGAQNTAFFFHQMGASHLAVPEGARAGVRAVFVHWVDALNWNTTKKTIEIYRSHEIYDLPAGLQDRLHAAIMARCKKGC